MVVLAKNKSELEKQQRESLAKQLDQAKKEEEASRNMNLLIEKGKESMENGNLKDITQKALQKVQTHDQESDEELPNSETIP